MNEWVILSIVGVMALSLLYLFKGIKAETVEGSLVQAALLIRHGQRTQAIDVLESAYLNNPRDAVLLTQLQKLRVG